MKNAYEGPFTATPPMKGDVAVIIRKSGAVEVLVPETSPLEITNKATAETLDPVITGLALWHLVSTEPGLIEAARRSVLSAVESSVGPQ